MLFYQIFSVDYKDEDFIRKLLSGGGGNSTLCATWMQLVGVFIKNRISEKAYNLLIEKIKDEMYKGKPIERAFDEASKKTNSTVRTH